VITIDDIMVKFEELKPGLEILVDGGFTCMNPGKYRVKVGKKGFYLRCVEGKHYLDGQLDDNYNLVGINHVE